MAPPDTPLIVNKRKIQSSPEDVIPGSPIHKQKISRFSNKTINTKQLLVPKVPCHSASAPMRDDEVATLLNNVDFAIDDFEETKPSKTESLVKDVLLDFDFSNFFEDAEIAPARSRMVNSPLKS